MISKHFLLKIKATATKDVIINETTNSGVHKENMKTLNNPPINKIELDSIITAIFRVIRKFKNDRITFLLIKRRFN